MANYINIHTSIFINTLFNTCRSWLQVVTRVLQQILSFENQKRIPMEFLVVFLIGSFRQVSGIARKIMVQLLVFVTP